VNETAGTGQGGIVLLYHRPLGRGAATVLEHVDAFPKFSRSRVWTVNTELGFPSVLPQLPCDVLVFHYSLFGIWPYTIGREFERYITGVRAHKIAFFQDEHRYCGRRFEFLNTYGVDTVSATVQIAKALVSREVPKVKVQVVGLLHATPQPQTVSVKVSGTAEELDAFNPEVVVARVDPKAAGLDITKPGNGYLDVLVDVPKVSVEVTPSKVFLQW